MAHVASNNHGNTNLPSSTPFMDQLTHDVIKETSKSLRYYIDVKRRENAFVLNPNSSSLDSIPLKARFIYGTTKEYPPLYGSFHSDNDVKVYLRSFQQQPKQPYSTSNSPERQMCRKELNFHMREGYKYSSNGNQKFNELRLGPPSRSISSCSRTNGPNLRRRTSKSAFKSSRREQTQLIDATADILASMIKTRRTIYETNFLSQQTPPNYVSRNTNPSPRQADDQSNIRSLSPTAQYSTTDLKNLQPIEEPKKQKRTTENALEKAASIMYNAKPITKGILCDYKVSIKTGNCNGASTNAPIYIKFYGTRGYTNSFELKNSETHRVPFLKNQTDVFTIRTYHVEQLAGITIGHELKDIRASWFLDKVSIDDPIRKITYEIPCNSWLSSTSIDQKTMRDFQVASTVSHKKHSNLDERQEEFGSQSSSSITTTERTRKTSSSTNRSQNDQLIDHKRSKKHEKPQPQPQQRVSIGPTTVAKKSTSFSAITNQLSEPPSATTVESHFNHKEFSQPSIPPRRISSPVISSRSTSDAEIEKTINNQEDSTTPTPSPTFDQSRTRFTSDDNRSQTTDSIINNLHKRHSIEQNRPPARLEKRNSPIPLSPERPIKDKEEPNENEAFSFFD